MPKSPHTLGICQALNHKTNAARQVSFCITSLKVFRSRNFEVYFIEFESQNQSFKVKISVYKSKVFEVEVKVFRSQIRSMKLS